MLRKAATGILGGTIGVGTYRYLRIQQRESSLPTQSLAVFEAKDNINDNDDAQKKKPKRVLIIGGGVVGITTAYKLAMAAADQSTTQIAILEANPQPGSECSACAAGGMQRSNPVVDYNSWISVCKCIAPGFSQWIFGGKSEPFKFFHIDWYETLSDPFFLRWVLTFTKTSLLPPKQQEYFQQQMLQFTKYAVDDEMVPMMENPKDGMGKASGYNNTGCMSVSYDEIKDKKTTTKDSAAAAETTTNKNPTASKMNYEPGTKITGIDQILEIEPSLKHQKVPPTAATFQYEARAASSERFTLELARRLREDKNIGKHVSFFYDTTVKAITTNSSNNQITQIKTNRGVIDIPSDVQIVVAAGAWTPRILSLMGLFVPVYPLTGYSMSVSAKQSGLSEKDLPSRIVCDKYMFTSRLGPDEIRITSIGKFSGWSTKPTPQVDQEFRREAIRQFPQLQSLIEQAKTKCGHRPYVNDGILLLGPCSDTYPNLHVSCGPGSNGWKLALGSGEIITRFILSNQTPEMIQKDLGFDVSPFSPAGRVLHSPFFAKLCRIRWDI